jgi:oligopeptide/dipeptide ABC transporter ATP-binding protein
VALGQAGAPAMELRDLRIEIPTAQGVVVPTDGISLSLAQGEVLGVVGETGSGKTVTCRAMLGLLPTRNAVHTGTVTYPAVGPDDILSAKPAQLRRLWGDYVAMIPQNPMTSLDPIRRIGDQIGEAVTAHRDCSRSERRQRVIELMQLVNIPAPERRLDDYPHQFSGGMLQRTLIAIALAGNPKVLIADEPTTALDVIIEDQILGLLLELQQATGLSLVLVSHDLSVVSQVCDRVAVMYAGQVVEHADIDVVLDAPRHPYTSALLNALPGAVARDVPLATIPGTPPQLIDLGSRCRFMDRCGFADETCAAWTSELLLASAEHEVRCIRHQELALRAGDPSTTTTGQPRVKESP